VSGAVEQSLAILEAMALHPGGMQVSAIAARLDQPVSGVPRQLREFERLGYVRQIRAAELRPRIETAHAEPAE
jgi:DNA-binding IclR family transcriptional regulator